MKRRTVIGGLVGSAFVLRMDGSFAPALAAEPDSSTPEQFGAKGDGRTNDSAAFAALADHVNREGGGTIALRAGATYIVGAQTRGPRGHRYAFEAARLMELVGCSRPLVIRGNGAKLKAAGRLRFGTFDPRTGAATNHPLPYVGAGELATPYGSMIRIERCTALVEISDLELDGSVQQLIVGGPWGDTGHQIPAYGIALSDNRGPEVLRNVSTHHHALDGLVIDGLDAARPSRSRLENVVCEYNGRQGCSIVGGRGYDFVGCRFNHTGRSAVSTAPGSGVDIEAENKLVRDLTFTNCEFSNNAGVGLVADSGDSADAVFTGCTFVGTTYWAAWPRKPGFRFNGCTFVGAVVNAFADAARPARATRFVDCRFLDDPALSPTRQVHGATLVELSTNPSVAFVRCAFRSTHRTLLPWTNLVTYEDCTMSQRSTQTAYPRGRFLGRNTISGPVALSGSTVVGELIVNGVRYGRGPIG